MSKDTKKELSEKQLLRNINAGKGNTGKTKSVPKRNRVDKESSRVSVTLPNSVIAVLPTNHMQRGETLRKIILTHYASLNK